MCTHNGGGWDIFINMGDKYFYTREGAKYCMLVVMVVVGYDDVDVVEEEDVRQ